jgi:hypothetical protein
MADGNFDYRAFFTGIDPSGGGKDEFGQNIPGMIPGGGALGGLAQVAGGIADIAGSMALEKKSIGSEDLKETPPSEQDKHGLD